MKKNPLVSCIITCYNSKDFIKDAIDSVINQSYENIEIIIVDDHSTDGSINIINSFQDKRIIKVFHDKNYGLPAKARNSGLKIATGEYIAFLDGDDSWIRTKITKQLDVFYNLKEVIAVGSVGNIIGEQDGFRKSTNSSFSKNGLLSFDDVINGNSAPLSSLMIKNIEPKMFFNEKIDFLYVEDFLFQLNILISGKKLFIIEDELINYRIHPDNGSFSKKKMKNIFNVIDLFETQLGSEGKKKLYQKYSFGIGLKMFRLRDGNAKKYFSYSFKSDNYKLKGYSMFMIILCFFPSSISKRLLSLVYRFANYLDSIKHNNVDRV